MTALNLQPAGEKYDRNSVQQIINLIRTMWTRLFMPIGSQMFVDADTGEIKGFRIKSGAVDIFDP